MRLCLALGFAFIVTGFWIIQPFRIIPEVIRRMLPVPTPDALAHSQRVTAHLQSLIDNAGGWIPFSRYMEAALYAPGLGYYAAGAMKFGAAGDFVTAPEMTPLFGRTLAHAIAPVLVETGGEVLELGAGSGRLAADVLGELARLGTLPSRYCILEVSADLRQRQQETLAREQPHLRERVRWLDALPDHFNGVILGNEVLDALPVELVHWTDAGPLARGVTWTGEGFAWQDRAHPTRNAAHPRRCPCTAARLSERNQSDGPRADRSLAERLDRGLILMIDYGFSRAEYYHPQRHMGTLRAHYRHHALDDPFYLPGLCDLTAHVDFSAMAAGGKAAGLELAGYTSQASFLLNSRCDRTADADHAGPMPRPTCRRPMPCSGWCRRRRWASCSRRSPSPGLAMCRWPDSPAATGATPYERRLRGS
jgi:SAM-dependent MidA family methyltransferase